MSSRYRAESCGSFLARALDSYLNVSTISRGGIGRAMNSAWSLDMYSQISQGMTSDKQIRLGYRLTRSRQARFWVCWSDSLPQQSGRLLECWYDQERLVNSDQDLDRWSASKSSSWNWFQPTRCGSPFLSLGRLLQLEGQRCIDQFGIECQVCLCK